MPTNTDNFRFHVMEVGDKLYPGYDQRNMQAVENQLAALWQFVGPGVIQGWDVSGMALTGSYDTDQALLAERQALITAEPYSLLGLQYSQIGSPIAEWEWGQVVKVTAGSGVVGVYPASTGETAYHRYTANGLYYVWVEPSACLVSRGIARISFPEDGDPEYNAATTATYLAQVEVVSYNIPGDSPDAGSKPQINPVNGIVYGDSRNALKDLAGALQQALRLSFYRHVHLGGPDHPSKIDLSSEITLTASGPAGSTIFLLLDDTGNTFKWASATDTDTGDVTVGNLPVFGIPIVRLNGQVLAARNYRIDAPNGKIYLKNSIAAGAVLQVVLPKSPQTRLTLHPDSSMSSAEQFLTDGVSVYDASTNTTGPRRYTWDASLYLDAQVYLNGALIDPSEYVVRPDRGSVAFGTPPSGYPASALTVLITRIGVQVTNKLPGTRVANVDASQFTSGTLDARRIAGLDHVGQVRYKETCVLRPSLRLLSEGDHTTFYPERASSTNLLEYGTDVHVFQASENFAVPLLGTKRGLWQSPDGVSAISVTGWNRDFGVPVEVIDDVLQDDPFTNQFKTTYVRTAQGTVYSSADAGESWQALKLPNVLLPGGFLAIPSVTALWVSTDRVPAEQPSGEVVDTWYSVLYLGTNYGLWHKRYEQGQSIATTGWDAVLLNDPGDPHTINCVLEMVTLQRTVSDSGDQDSYDHTLYVGVSGTYGGLYAGGTRVSSSIVPLGMLWLRGDIAQNQLLWWTATDVYVSHTAWMEQTSDPNANSSTTTWHHPLTPSGLAYPTGTQIADVRAATVGINIILSGPLTLDGITLVDGDRVLVKDQTDATKNGIYTVSTAGAWTRATDQAISADITASEWVNVTAGTANGGSRWVMTTPGTSYTIGTTAFTWREYWVRPLTALPSAPTRVRERTSTGEYYVFTGGLPYRLTDRVNPSLVSVWLPAETETVSAWQTTMGEPRDLLEMNGGTRLVFASSRGLWETDASATAFARTANSLTTLTPSPTLYDETTGTLVSDAFAVSLTEQSVVFSVARDAWMNLVMEKDYVNYYTAPWNASGAEVVVYIQGQPSTIGYTLTPSAGQITFATSLDANALVQITIVRAGAYISGVGQTPHEEIPLSYITASSPVTTLAQDLATTSQVITVATPTAIPMDTRYIELRSSAGRERVSITINPATYQITSVLPRSGAFVFPANDTQVFLVDLTTQLGIEDQISLVQSNQTYHLNSLGGVNLLQLAIAAQAVYPNLFRAWYGYTTPLPTDSDLGPKNALFFDFTTDAIDATASASTLYEGLDPTSRDNPVVPRVAYALFQPVVNGDGTVLGTDQGVWQYTTSTSTWKQLDPLAPSSRVYFLQNVDNTLTAGTDTGLWQQAGDGTWAKNTTYPLAVFSHAAGSAFGGTYEAWGKEDGLAFVLQANGQNSFTSDHFDPLDGHHVYGIWYGQYYTLDGDPPVKHAHDALYLCTDQGLWGVALGGRSGVYASLLKGRDMFLDSAGNNALRVPITLPDGSATSAPVKAYGIFQAPALPPNSNPPVPIFILTNNGVYKVRNWRWCDPTDAGNGLSDVFTIEHLGMPGVASYCSASSIHDSSDGTYAKLFVGGEKGVWRSVDEGVTWQRCERLVPGRDIPVYDLKMVGTGMWAATREGLFYTADDGDTWQAPVMDGNTVADFSNTVSNAVLLGGSSQAQTFISDQTTLTKVSLYLSTRTLPPGDSASVAAQGNTVAVGVYAVDSSGLPTGIPLASGSASLAAQDITYPNFYSFDLSAPLTVTVGTTYALVATETIASGAAGTSVIQWHRSRLDSPYGRGNRVSGVGSSTVTWTPVASDDFFFRVFQQAPVAPTTTVVPAGITSVPGRGTVVLDNGSLTADFKFAIATVVDDSHSMVWGDPRSRRGSELLALITNLQTRTTSAGLTKSYADVWVTQSDALERTNGYSNSNALLSTALTTLYQRSLADVLIDTTGVAISGLSPQSIVDALLQPGDATGNQERIGTLVTYLEGVNQLRLADIVAFWQAQPAADRSAWDGQAATIANYPDVSTFVAMRWAQSFLPLAVIASDGDGDGDLSPITVAAQSAWLGLGAPIYTFGLGRAGRESSMRTIAASTGGRYIAITDETDANADWTASVASFVPGGANDLFVATWGNLFDFADATYIRQVDTTYTAPTGSAVNTTCVVKVRWTADRIHWSPWATVSSGVTRSVEQLLLALEFSVEMTAGYDATAGTICPVVSTLTYTQVSPSVQYLLTPAQSIHNGGSVFEYLLSAAYDLPPSALLSWGIVRGDSTDFADFEPVFNGRKGCLSNRQQSIEFTTPIVRSQLMMQAVDTTYRTYRVLENGAGVFWSTSDVVQVFVKVGASYVELDPARARYSLDGALGRVYFEQSQLAAQIFVVTITTPPTLERVVGEPTTTADDKTYTLANGRWPHDATAIVLVNGQLRRGGYFASPGEGTITFDRELQNTDIVTVYVQNASTFRVGVEIRNYGESAVQLKNFGLIYTTKQNTGLLAAYGNSEPPTASGVQLSPTGATVYQRLTVGYTFAQKDGNPEQDTQIIWYRKRTTESSFTAITGYDGRITEKATDTGNLTFLAQGDSVYVTVQPGDVIQSGAIYASPTVVLGGDQIPVVRSVVLLATGKTENPANSGNFYVPAGQAITASYAQTDGDGGSDLAVVRWYVKDAASAAYTGKMLPANFTQSGQTYSATVTPYDGQQYGIPVRSEYVTIQ